MSQDPDSKFTPQSAEKALKGKAKFEGKVITVPKQGIGLHCLAALDYLQKFCGAIVKYDHTTDSNTIPSELRGKIIIGSNNK